MGFGLRGTLFSRDRMQRRGKAPPRQFGSRSRADGSAPDMPRAERHATRLEIVILPATGEPLPSVAHDLSVTGFSATMPTPLPVGALSRVVLPGGRAKHFRVARQAGLEVGCEFTGMLDQEELDRLLSVPMVEAAPLN